MLGIGVGFCVYFAESILYFCVGVFVGFLGAFEAVYNRSKRRFHGMVTHPQNQGLLLI